MNQRPVTQEELEAAQESWRRQVQVRIVAALATPSTAPDILEGFSRALIAVDSHGRLPLLLDLVRRRPSRIFWPVLIEWWSVCDDTWIWRTDLLRYLRRHHAKEPGPTYLQEDDRAFFDSLPETIEVYRGCSRPRVRGISWSTERAVAIRFAEGHRGIRVPDPVLARAFIPKEAVFIVSTDRNESEVILDPARLRQLEVAPAT